MLSVDAEGGHALGIAVRITVMLLILLSFSVVQAQAESSYIIVHALNPEGVEIASIEGMGQNSVEIYDGNTLIGYGAYNNETHNKPITIDAGSHTIKVKFNGITTEQNIILSEGETQTLTFTFPRIEFDILSKIKIFSGSSQYTYSEDFNTEVAYIDHTTILEGEYYIDKYIEYRGIGSISVDYWIEFDGENYSRGYDCHYLLTGGTYYPYIRERTLIHFGLFNIPPKYFDGGNGLYTESNLIPSHTEFS